MTLPRLRTLIVGLILVAGACNSPEQKHRDAGPDGMTDVPKEGTDLPPDMPTGDDAEAGSDVPNVIATPGSVEVGKPCGKDADCDSTFCRDGVCCKTDCKDTCNACSMALTNLENGVCGPVTAGMDPREDCADESTMKSCGQDGTCDGKGACRKQGPDHVCAQASCSTDNKFTPAGTCDGKGTCAIGTVMACGGNPCALTGCAKPCTKNDDCPAGNFCSNGTCKVKKIAGDACDTADQCTSANCSPDKVCCDSACTGACMACTEALTGQKNGTCAAVQSGKDPKDDCTADMPKSCGKDGTCDGKGGCRYYDSSVACSDPGCNGTMYSAAGACDSKGACAPVVPIDCGQAMCTLNGCKKSCTSGSDCAAGSYCVTATMACAPKKANGLSCGSPIECTSGACVDGVCCESACQGKCYACSSDKTGQTSGRCLPISAGTDPDTECDSSDQTSCGLDGTCDGHGQCRKWASGTQCAAAMCTTDNKYQATRTCDGNGTCAAATPEDCGGSVCALSGCKKTCAGNQDCSGNNYCDTSVNTCAAQKNLGTTCKMGVECLSQSCVDGVCCESSCQGKCYACSNDRTGQASGRCQPITLGTDPDNECDGSDPTTCLQNGSCDGKGQCAKWSAGTMCGAASCNTNQFQPTRSCDGSGSCATQPAQDCGATVCNPNSGCGTTCSDDSGCFGSNYCDIANHTCAAKKTLGGPCAKGNECTSTFCAPDGVCCNNACNGKCSACVKEKTGLATSGTCGAIPSGSDPDNECGATDASMCGLDGSCDGNGQCRKWASGTQCAAAMCSSNKYTPAGTCDGNGMCNVPSAQDCTPNMCGANGCPKTCTTTGDCTTGNYCDTGTHMCAPLKNLGDACGSGAECKMGICADGVCCNTSCGNACQACNLQNSKGTCTAVSGNPPAGHPTCAGTDAACAGTCAGSADGQCTFAPKSCGVCKNCNSGVCQKVTNGSQTDCATMCDMNGACQTPASLTLVPDAGSSTSFGTVVIGSTSRQKYVVSNTGQQSSSNITISISGTDFSRVSPGAGECTDGMVLIGGTQCRVQIEFKPMSTGLKQGSMMVGATVGGSPAPLTLTGTGKQSTGVVTEFEVLDIGSGTIDTIVASPDGNLWFLDLTRPRIFRATTSGVVSAVNIPNTAGSPIFFIGAGSDGNLWFSDHANNSIGRITSQGNLLAEFPLGQHGQFQLSAGVIARGADGNMWFSSGDYSIIRMTTSGAITGDFPTATGTTGLRMGPDNQLWFNMQNDMGKINTSGTVTEMTTITDKPIYWAAGPDGNLWGTRAGAMVGDTGTIEKISPSGGVTKFPLTATGAYPRDITAGPDGNIWFTENVFTKNGNFFNISGHIGRITPAGVITDFPIPTSTNSADNIALGSDGNLWFLENVQISGTSKLARINP